MFETSRDASFPSETAGLNRGKSHRRLIRTRIRLSIAMPSNEQLGFVGLDAGVSGMVGQVPAVAHHDVG